MLLGSLSHSVGPLVAQDAPIPIPDLEGTYDTPHSKHATVETIAPAEGIEDMTVFATGTVTFGDRRCSVPGGSEHFAIRAQLGVYVTDPWSEQGRKLSGGKVVPCCPESWEIGAVYEFSTEFTVSETSFTSWDFVGHEPMQIELSATPVATFGSCTDLVFPIVVVESISFRLNPVSVSTQRVSWGILKAMYE